MCMESATRNCNGTPKSSKSSPVHRTGNRVPTSSYESWSRAAARASSPGTPRVKLSFGGKNKNS